MAVGNCGGLALSFGRAFAVILIAGAIFTGTLRSCFSHGRTGVSLTEQSPATQFPVFDRTRSNNSKIIEPHDNVPQTPWPGMVSSMPRCIASCVFPRMVEYGCSSTDFVCMCGKFAMIDQISTPKRPQESLQPCIENCGFFDSIEAAGRWLDLCEALDVEVILPQFMSDSIHTHGRHVKRSSIDIFPTPIPVPVETVTSTQPWGVPASTTTIFPGSSGGTTVVVLAVDTSVSTFTTSTTLLPGATGYTSTIMAQDSPAITLVFGITPTSSSEPGSSNSVSSTTSKSPSPTSLSFSSSSATSFTSMKSSTVAPVPSGSHGPALASTPKSESNGLSLGAKIALGVAIPLFVLTVTGILLFLLRRRRATPATFSEPQETSDGGLPEHVTAISQAEKYSPQYRFNELEGAIGVPDQDIDRSHTVVMPHLHELNNDPAFGRHELNADGTGDARYDAHQLAHQPHKSSSATPRVGPVSSCPAPWENAYDVHSDQQTVASMSPAAVPNSSTLALDPSGCKDDPDLKAMEIEMAQIRENKERLEQLQAFVLREEELKRNIEERRRGGGQT